MNEMFGSFFRFKRESHSVWSGFFAYKNNTFSFFAFRRMDGSITLGGSQRVKKFALDTDPPEDGQRTAFVRGLPSGGFSFYANFSPCPLTSPTTPI